MTRSTGQSPIFLWAMLFFLMSYHGASASRDSLNEIRIRAAEQIRIVNPDSAIQVLNSMYDSFVDQQDTLAAIKVLITLASVNGNMSNYRASYNCLWKALLLAEEAHLDQIKVRIYQRIGRYYAFYKRREKALAFLGRALSLNKSLVDRGEMNEASLSQRYMSFSTTFLEFGELSLAQLYLDSCRMYTNEEAPGSVSMPYFKIQEAFLHVEQNRSDIAIREIEALVPWFKSELPSYLVLVYSFLGDAYFAKELKTKSEWCYLEALRISSKMHSHVDFSVLTREKLANLYCSQERHEEAYQQLKDVLTLDRLFFDSRSEYNRPLLEIQDEFRNTMDAKEQLLKENRIAQLEHENRVKFLRNIIFSVLFLSTILMATLLFFYMRNKHRVEKRLINLEVKAKQELLEMKNRELATSALKLVEKDKFLHELKDKVTEKKEKVSAQEINHLIKKATVGNTNTWKAFESQFVAVNNGFFDELRKMFPNLTQGERRLCALIKLKLTSKEIASLMGISVESVHKSRYRLRKKFGLEKGTDLTDFIGGIV